VAVARSSDDAALRRAEPAENGDGAAFGTVLRRLRLRANLSQGALAERARVGVQTIGSLERGDRQVPYRETVALLAAALGLSPSERALMEAAAVRPDRPRRRRPGLSKHHLPLHNSSLIGRDSMVSEVATLLAAHRLVTLVGSGGVGKTRAALAVAERVLSDWRDGVWFVGLAPLADPTLVAGAIRGALGLRDLDGRSERDHLLSTLRSQRLLVVLDNCEHVIDEAAALVDAILRSCPNASILATSRERLNVAGENVYRTPSLPAPPQPDPLQQPTTQLDAESSLAYPAVALFVDRARAVANFDFRDADAPVVAEICRRLDGIPLAIELAAARLLVLRPSELLTGLNERMRILTNGHRAALPRQQTMRAAIDWSHDLLSPCERVVFRRLGIFAGGWTRAAAEATGADAHTQSASVFDALASLVEKSLVLAEPHEVETRYRFLESTRDYALEKLEESGERPVVARRHAEWTAQLLEWCGDASLSLPTSRWLPLAELEMDNARGALEWALSPAGDALLAARIAANPPRRTISHDAERRRWIEAALARLDESEHPAVAARLRLTESILSPATESIVPAAHTAALFERAGSDAWVAVSLTILVQGLICAGRLAEAESAIDRALDLLLAADAAHSPVFARALARKGEVMISLDRRSQARRLLAESIALSDDLRDGYSSYFARFTLSHLAFVEGDAASALQLLQACIAIAQDEQLPFLAGLARDNVADCRLALGEVDEAAAAARESLPFVRRVGWPLQILGTIHTLAIVAARRSDFRRAARLRGYVLERCRVDGYELEPAWHRADASLVALLRAALNDVEIEALDAEGARLDEDAAVAAALMDETDARIGPFPVER
jgi:predicted ATPase/transcriptional regulator with XRE-family HTH domain